MKIFGWEVTVFNNNTNIAITVGAVLGGGACYAILRYLLSSNFGKSRRPRLRLKGGVADGERDLSLPLILEQEYGSFRQLCSEADPVAAQYLQEIPDHFFAFPQNFLKFISNFVSDHTNRYLQALVVGSRTGYLVFALGTIFDEVKGVERSFSQIVTCYQFQNFNTVSHSFPAEGALKIQTRVYKSPISATGPFQLRRSGDFRKKNKENIEFIHADLDKLSLTYLGKFQVVVLQNCLEDLEDPLLLLESLKDIVVEGGFLIISSDYNWNNKLRIPVDSTVSTSAALLRRVLEDSFEFKEDKNIPEVICESTRNCRVRYNHVTTWTRCNHNFTKNSSDLNV